MRNKPNAIRVLLQEGADVNQQSGVDGMAALHLSTIYNCTDAIRILLQQHTLTTINNDRGQKPFDDARKGNNKEAVFLLQH